MWSTRYWATRYWAGRYWARLAGLALDQPAELRAVNVSASRSDGVGATLLRSRGAGIVLGGSRAVHVTLEP